MANADYLILAIGVGAIVIAIAAGAVLYEPPPPTDVGLPPPRADIRLETTQGSYRIGEEVVGRLENLGPLSLCTLSQWPWSVTRQVGDEWRRVRPDSGFLSLGSVRPGEALGFRWVAESFPDWELNGLAEVLPGNYRVGFGGWLCGEMAPEPRVNVGFHAYFELVA